MTCSNTIAAASSNRNRSNQQQQQEQEQGKDSNCKSNDCHASWYAWTEWWTWRQVSSEAPGYDLYNEETVIIVQHKTPQDMMYRPLEVVCCIFPSFFLNTWADLRAFRPYSDVPDFCFSFRTFRWMSSWLVRHSAELGTAA